MPESAAFAMPDITLENWIVFGMMTSGVSSIKIGVPVMCTLLRDQEGAPWSALFYGYETYVNRLLTLGRDPSVGCQRKPTRRFRRRS